MFVVNYLVSKRIESRLERSGVVIDVKGSAEWKKLDVDSRRTGLIRTEFATDSSGGSRCK